MIRIYKNYLTETTISFSIFPNFLNFVQMYAVTSKIQKSVTCFTVGFESYKSD